MPPVRIESCPNIQELEGVALQPKPTSSLASLFGREVVVGPPQPSPMTRRQFLKTSGAALGALALTPLSRSPNSLSTSPTNKPSESHLLSDLLLGHYLESGNIDDLQQFIPDADHQTNDELSLFLSPDIPFEIWTGVNSEDKSDPGFIFRDAFVKASAIPSTSKAGGCPLRLFVEQIEKAEKSGDLKKLSNHMFWIGTNYDNKWYVSNSARHDQEDADRITQGYISVDRLLFDDLGYVIITGRKRMKPLVVKKPVKKFFIFDSERLEVNDQPQPDESESETPELTFMIKVKIKDLPNNVWGGKFDPSKSPLDCQAALVGNWLESMRQNPNLVLQREIIAWPRKKSEVFWDNVNFGGVNISNKIGTAVNAEPNFDWQIDGHLATSVYYDPAIYDFDHPPRNNPHTRAFVSGAIVKIPVGVKLFLHGLQRRTKNGEFIALVEAKDETYAPGNLPQPLYSAEFNFRTRYRGKFFWVSHQDLQTPAVRVKQK